MALLLLRNQQDEVLASVNRVTELLAPSDGFVFRESPVEAHRLHVWGVGCCHLEAWPPLAYPRASYERIGRLHGLRVRVLDMTSLQILVIHKMGAVLGLHAPCLALNGVVESGLHSRAAHVQRHVHDAGFVAGVVRGGNLLCVVHVLQGCFGLHGQVRGMRQPHLLNCYEEEQAACPGELMRTRNSGPYGCHPHTSNAASAGGTGGMASRGLA
mmetsp:Transcript_7359/g.16780  ORF Transcript_7359/g.16780 Transcript_7359/m.16780 type:complete len:213 (+) Transcript_7359:367-1005(+)